MSQAIEPVDFVIIILMLAVLVGCVNRLWIGLPPAIGMLLGSLLVSLLIVSSDHIFHLHIMRWFRATFDAAHLPKVFLDGVLALLLFAGSLHVDLAELNRRRWTIAFLATASVILSTLIFGGGIWAISNLIGAVIPLAWCFVLGAILAPTDAVALESILQRANLPMKLRAAVVGESLFNDGAGVVLFLLALGVTQGQTVKLGHGVVMVALLREIAGGAALGLAAGWVAAFLIRRVHDSGLQLLISVALGLGCYRLANLSHFSGPIAVVAAGLCMASPSPGWGMGEAARAAIVGFWSLLDQLLNAVLFLLVGLQLLGLFIQPSDLLPITFVIPLAMVSRLVSVAVPLALTREPSVNKGQHIAVLTWAGLRGAISVALALTLPVSPWRIQLLVATYAVVVFTMVIQGLTFPRFLKVIYGATKPVDAYDPGLGRINT
jgi:CPA1 family monovalent cation:H+ antiporter